MTKFVHGFLYYSLDKDEREYQAELLKTQKERDKERRTQEDTERESELQIALTRLAGIRARINAKA